jgi:hypothetical protein
LILHVFPPIHEVVDEHPALDAGGITHHVRNGLTLTDGKYRKGGKALAIEFFEFYLRFFVILKIIFLKNINNINVYGFSANSFTGIVLVTTALTPWAK